MKIFSKKIVLVFIICSLIFSYGYFLNPQKIEAGAAPVIDFVHIGKTVAGWAKEMARWAKEDMMKTLRDTIAKRLIDNIVDQTIQWIQGGGKPQFVTDWKGFLRNAGDIAQDQIIKEVGLTPLCSPFKLQVQLSLLPTKRFGQRIECTLDDIVENIEDFYQDFRKGGWIAYNEAWQPQNNYFGQILLIHDEMISRTREETEAAKNDALSGGGFLSVKKCEGGLSKEVYCDSKCVKEISAKNIDEADLQVVMDACNEQCMATQMNENELCKASGGKEKIVTPGDVVGKATADAITSDNAWAQNIQSWTSALVNAMINRVITEGVAYLQGSDSSDDVYYPPEYEDITNQQFKQEKKQMTQEIQKFTNEWQYLLNAKKQSLSYASSTKKALEELKQIQASTTPQLSPNCEPWVTEQEISSSTIEINRLTRETNDDLQIKLNEGNDLIIKIEKADFWNIRERSLTQTAYQEFTTKYGTDEFLESIISGVNREAADKEKELFLKQYTNPIEEDGAKDRLIKCQKTPLP